MSPLCSVPVLFSIVAASVALAGPEPALDGPCRTATPRAVLVSDGEPGDPLVVRGRILHADGRTPAAGVILYVYQTDMTGIYFHDPGARAPRLRGWMRTDAEGRYEYRTIRPGAYPQGTIAAHVHTQIWGPGVPAQYGPQLLFTDDPLVRESERRASADADRFAWVREPALRDGALEVEHDIRLGTSGQRFEDDTAHGYRACTAPESP